MNTPTPSVKQPNSAQLRVLRRNALGMIELNRPNAHNALSFAMLRSFTASFAAFEADPTIGAILIRGDGRAFCAGGDVEAIASMRGGPEFERMRRDFFAAEYRINRRIHTCQKPCIALIDGITMGGGCGLSLHGSHVVTTERTSLSMPEMAIGHFPDAGGTSFLNRLPGEMGVYVALRGLRLNGAEVMALGLGTHYVNSAQLPMLIDALATEPGLDRETTTPILDRFRTDPGKALLPSRRQRIDELFGGATLEDIVDALGTAKENWAVAALDALGLGSPTSLKVALRQLREGRGLGIDAALKVEYRIAVRITGSDDFREGVRAVMIDKDNAPRWRPDRLEAVTPEAVDCFFAPLAPEEPELEFAD
jgi:enoyl-CoA hydratase